MDESRLKEIAGAHHETFEGYFIMVNTDNTGIIKALDAAKFLMKSGLSDVVLSRVWDLSDPNGNGYLDKTGFYTALKLVSLAQSGEQMKITNLMMTLNNPPKCGEIPPKVLASINQVRCIPVGNVDWSIAAADRFKYEQMFESMGPENGLIPGNKVRNKLMESKLKIDILGRIWDLADQDKDGSLDKNEFVIAWHLVCVALGKRVVPETLPPVLMKPKASTDEFVAVFPDRISPPPAVPPLPAAIQKPVPGRPPVPMATPASLIDIGGPLLSSAAPPSNEWVVTVMQKLKYDEIFEKADLDHDGLVSGGEIKDVFLKSGLPTKTLADIWGLCDTSACGKLTREQFALAMWFVERKQKENIDPPKKLEPNMVPPSLRPKIAPPPVVASAIPAPLISGLPPSTALPLIPDDPPQPTYSNPELQMISEDIQKLAKERRQLELEVAQKEADIKIKGGEVRSLESELTTLAATLKQLEYQKGEAQKRLDDLRAQVDKVREQCHKQEEVLKETETEVDVKRAELQKLKEEEQQLQKDSDESQRKLELLTKILQETQLQISQVKAMLTQLEETKRQMSDSLALCKAAIEQNDPNSVPDYSLNLEPELHDAKKLLEDRPDPTLSPEKPAAPASTGFNNGFQAKFDDSWNDPFGATANAMSNDGTKFDDSFGASFDKPADPFAATNKADPFAPKQDAFGSDPFAALHAPRTAAEAALTPTPTRSGPPARPESPSPALPPKKAKPMRPPPPRPATGPSRSKSPASDAFGDSFNNSGSGFANFADFDNKQIQMSVPTQPDSAFSKAPEVKASDFADDPFKNYRYEDVFNIEDPFADEKPPTTTITAFDAFDMKNDAADKNANTLNSQSGSLFDFFDDSFSEKVNTLNTKKNNFTDPFGDNKFGGNTNGNGNAKNNNGTEAAAFFDEFNDNFGDFKITDTNFAATNTKSKNTKTIDNSVKKDFKSGYAKPIIKPRTSNNNNIEATGISKQDFSQEDKFDEVLAAVLERSKIEQ
ncbi:epidermal growth factor receptor substrate 15-like 1 isoform X2 [Culicoides brevitarsis]|uniref:epidermal growth factor receptor substrate 15-like 1 isoform X2 n=1 Tax=Culicoides brevitarsis TaxID=469753 RepID=UPI00307B58D1